MKNQEKKIQQSLTHQQKNLDQRIKRRSLSKSKNPQKQNPLPLPKLKKNLCSINL